MSTLSLIAYVVCGLIVGSGSYFVALQWVQGGHVRTLRHYLLAVSLGALAAVLWQAVLIWYGSGVLATKSLAAMEAKR